ncbi:MAG: MarR family transcriptional regulator [Candidatus Coatesbacteria bacterium]|nr:MAG: MarR family transcriptional regulator [Candidatus Coatesbacteria bacterium]
MGDYLGEFDTLFNRIRRAFFLELESRLAAAGYDDLPPAAARALIPISHETTLPLSSLAAELGFHKATITPLAKRLEKAGYVKREVDEEDGRVSYLGLTDRGRKAVLIVESVLADVSAEAFAGVTAEDRAALRRILFQIIENLGE